MVRTIKLIMRLLGLWILGILAVGLGPSRFFYVDMAFPIAYAEDPIVINVKDVPLTSLVMGISKTYGLDVIGADSLQGRISGRLHGTSGADLLRQLSDLKHFSLIEKEGAFFVEGEGMDSKEAKRQALVLKPQHIRPDSLKTSLESLVNHDHMALLNETNALVISANPQEFQAIQQVYKDLDVEPNQVQIEATIVALESSYAKEIGFSWSWLGLTGHGKDSTNSYGAISFGKTNEGRAYKWFVKPELSASQVEGRATLIARPSIMALNGQEAKILIGDRVPVLEESTASGEKSTHVRYEDVGIKLMVTPYVSPDKTVDASIYAEVSSPTYVSDLKAYKISARQAATRVRMKPGEVLVIGGLMDNRSGQSYKKIPLLGDIPLLGKLFQHARKTKDSVELVMLVKAQVL